VLSDAENKQWIDTGQVPIVTGTESQLAQSKDKDFLQFVYDIASKAKFFGQSWDQALDPTAAETLLDNIAKLFQLNISPQQFADNMNKVIGQ
jgi:raffinose/stachyose/melibiose transport system substrate-binding protein